MVNATVPVPTGWWEAAEAYQLPRLVRLDHNLYAACFTLMKLIPARYILRRAMESGRLDPDTVIVETTSGTFGLALAMQGVHLDRRVVLVSDPVIDERFARRLTHLGAHVERVPVEAGSRPGGYQAARLDRLAEIRAESPTSFCPEQYTNPDNPRSYRVVAEMLLEALGPVDCVVGPVGSGGSMCGTVTHLRTAAPECRAVGVDTPGSVLFGHPDAPRQLRGLGMSVLPANLDHRVFDSVHWCTAPLAYRATRALHRRHAVFMGPTSGAAYLVARWWARSHPDALTVVMLPDEGHRYQDTVYDDGWLATTGHLDGPVPVEPTPLDHPADVHQPWTTYPWARRSYADVMRPEPATVGLP
jgi:cysteine synthase A